MGKSCIPVRTPLFLKRLITRVTSLDTSSRLLKRFPRSGFFNFANKSKAGGLMSGLYSGWGSSCHPYFSKISNTAPEAWGRALMYDRWSLCEIWHQSVSSSISSLRSAEHGPRSLPIRTHCSLLKSGSQPSRKSESLHHPMGRTSTVCRAFEMTYVIWLKSEPSHFRSSRRYHHTAMTDSDDECFYLLQQAHNKHFSVQNYILYLG